jgi:hypothetical protein
MAPEFTDRHAEDLTAPASDQVEHLCLADDLGLLLGLRARW